MNDNKYLSMNGLAISPSIIVAALSFAGLTWAMRKAQILALEIEAFNGITNSQEVVGEVPASLVEHMPETKHTLGGIPIVIDEAIPMSTIELRLNDERIYRIENLAVPAVFSDEAWREAYGSEAS